MESVLRRCLVHGELIKVHFMGDEETTIFFFFHINDGHTMVTKPRMG